MPLLEQARRDYGKDRLAVVGVDVDEPAERVRSFVKSLAISYPIWTDPPAGAKGFDRTQEIFARSASAGLPTTLFIDRHGILVARYLGELTMPLITERVGALLGR